MLKRKGTGGFRRMAGIVLSTIGLCGFGASVATATPSTQVWIPSTDIQPYKTVHLNFDAYLRDGSNDDGSRTGPSYVVGPAVGILPFRKIQAEIGFDVISAGGDADNHPLYFHAKVGTPEGALFKLSPALAVGGYNFGTKSGDARTGELSTKQDILYALAAKTIPVVGRLSAGCFVGSRKALLDASGAPDEKGLLLSWDRVMTEISDRLWLSVDYQSGDSALGALSFGASWAFAKNVSVLLGYGIYNEERTGGRNTVTLQVDINFP